MDYPHHHLVYHHRNGWLRRPPNGLETVDTMRVKRVMMRVIHTAYVTLPHDIRSLSVSLHDNDVSLGPVDNCLCLLPFAGVPHL